MCDRRDSESGVRSGLITEMFCRIYARIYIGQWPPSSRVS